MKNVSKFFILYFALCSLSCTKKADLNNPIDAASKLLPPTEVTATPSADTLVTVKWKDSNIYPENTVVSYLVETDTTAGTFAQVGTSPTGTSEAKLLLQLKVGRQYVFRVRIQADKKYSDYSEQKTIQIQFTDPTNVTLTLQADTAIVVNWQYTGTFQTGFEIERQVGNGAFVKIKTARSTDRNYNDSIALKSGTQYKYRVRTISKNNTSTYAISTTLTATFTDPTNVSITAQADTAVLVNWQYTSTFQTGFEIERQIGSGAFTKVGVGKSTDRSFEDTITLIIGSQYTYRVRALSKNNTSTYAISTTLTATFTDPTNVSITAQADTAVVVNWQYTGTIHAGFVIERQIGSGAFVKIATVNSSERGYKDAIALAVGQQYKYQIKALNKTNTSGYMTSSVLSLSFPEPTNLTIISMTKSRVSLSWDDNSSFETGFEIEQSANGSNFTLLKTVGANTTTISIPSTFDSIITYLFHIRAISTVNQSLYSNTPSYNIVEATKAASAAGMLPVNGGTFTMGSENSLDAGASPTHSVTLSDFYFSSTEIRWGMWDSVYQWAKNNGYTDLIVGLPGFNGDGKHPVTAVNWYDVVKWCNARSEREGLTPVYYISTTFAKKNIYKTGQINLQNTMVNWNANGYRLPTEAEWEFAARGGNNTHGYTYSGSNSLDDVAWYLSNSGVVGNNYSTRPVGQKTANELGIYDMSGNVMEYCWDWGVTYNSSAQTNPYGPSTGTYRCVRGGDFSNAGSACRVAKRGSWIPDTRSFNESVGLRCARSK